MSNNAPPHATDAATAAARTIQLARRHGTIPRYGSLTWQALPAHDPLRYAAIVVAAECWRRDTTDQAIRHRLATELADARALALALVRDANRDLSRALQAHVDWKAVGRGLDRPRSADEWIVHYERNAARLRERMDAEQRVAARVAAA